MFRELRTVDIVYYVSNDVQDSTTKDITNAVESYNAMDAPKCLSIKIDNETYVLELEL